VSAAIETQGYEIVPDVVDSATVERLIQALDRAEPESTHRRSAATYAIRNLLQRVPEVKAIADSEALRRLIDPIIGSGARAIRALLFDKIPNANWKVFWHQDTAIPVRRRIDVPGFRNWSVKDGVQHVEAPDFILQHMLAVRIHLDSCGPDNGPLCVLPGSHLQGFLSAAGIDACKESISSVTCTIERGGVLLMRPLLLHASFPAKNPRHRRIIHIEYCGVKLPGGLEFQPS